MKLIFLFFKFFKKKSNGANLKQLSSQEIRSIFLDFFTNKDHKLISGSSVIPNNDPTLLYINSGMAPLKKYFLGTPPPHPKMSNIQPCIRTVDIEDVGDRHHLTFFEMLGSWSIGDYFKEEAIKLAFDLLTNKFQFPIDKLYATVYKGNPELNIPPDLESIKYWENAGLPRDQIVLLGEDNFWGPAGESGPCGPCTEVFYDTGDSYGPTYSPGGYFDDKNRYIEIWNAGVFMELNKIDNGTFSTLPIKSVDTGSGLERMYLAINQVDSLYEIDSIAPIYQTVQELVKSKEVSKKDIRIITDHLRTSTYLLGEEIRPDKDGRGYILRRLIRKSISIAKSNNVEPQDLKVVIEESINQLSISYPFLEEKRKEILKAFIKEVKEFLPKLEKGFEILNKTLKGKNESEIPTDLVFDLVTANGVPIEVIQDYSLKNNYTVDIESYRKKYRAHQEISRQGKNENLNIIQEIIRPIEPTIFVNKDKLKGTVIKLILNNTSVDFIESGNKFDLIADQTNFYAEGGGQVGDTGIIINESAEIEVINTIKIDDVYIHKCSLRKGSINTGSEIQLEINIQNQKLTSNNHTATHLLNSALSKVLGKEVLQKGSSVNHERLRFDFLNDKPLSQMEITEVEQLINSWISEGVEKKIIETNLEEAKNLGAKFLDNNEYGSTVRVVSFGSHSSELCGGTHANKTTDLLIFSIVKESAVSKGVRRIEAVTSNQAYKFLHNSQQKLKEAANLLSCTESNFLDSIHRIKQKPKLAVKSISAEFIKEQYFEINDTIKVAVLEYLGEDDSLVTKLSLEKMRVSSSSVSIVFFNNRERINVYLFVNKNSVEKLPANSILSNWLNTYGGKGGGKKEFSRGSIPKIIPFEDLLESFKGYMIMAKV